MIEIIAVVSLFMYLKEQLARRGRGKGLAFLAPVLWFVGEFAGAVVATMMGLAPEGGGFSIGLYAVALLGGAVGATVGILVVFTTPAVEHDCPACGEVVNLHHGRGRLHCKACKAKLRFVGGRLEVVGARRRSVKSAES